MSTLFNKTVMIMLLCLIFIGQSMASSTMFYKMTAMSAMGNMSHTSSMKMDTMVHHVENTVINAHSNESSTAECCQQECKCFASGCSAPSAFSKTFTTDILVEASTKIQNHNLVLPEQALSSLFRPPILS